MHIATPVMQIRRIVSTILIGGFLLSACGGENNKQISELEKKNHPDVLATFNVEIPEPLPPNYQLSLELVDPLVNYQP